MKYKVGDRVRIKSLDWYNENKTIHGDIWFDNAVFVGGQSLYCGCELTIRLVTNDSYYVIENDYYWTDEMIEGLVEEETKPKIIEEAKTYLDSIKDAWICPDGYIFKDENGNEILTSKIILEKKNEYPKTYDECCKVLGYVDRETYCVCHTYANERLFESLYRLKVYRDAYWKIAGDEMCLGEPWKPDWTDDNAKYSIYTIKGALTKAISCYDGAILAFPTEEMRDAFYESFKELINECKELL